MKMNKDIFKEIVKRFSETKTGIKIHAEVLKEHGGYSCFNTRLAWDCLHGVFKSHEITEWHFTGLNDNHINTGAIKALKQIGIL